MNYKIIKKRHSVFGSVTNSWGGCGSVRMLKSLGTGVANKLELIYIEAHALSK